MAKRDLPLLDLHNVVRDRPVVDGDSMDAPRINLQDPHMVPQSGSEGVDNLAFSPDLPAAVLPALPTIPAIITRAGSATPGARASPSPTSRRGSLLPPGTASLSVPGSTSPRRHSLGTVINSESATPVIPTLTPIMTPTPSLTPVLAGSTLNIDYLSMPRSSINSVPPLSPGGRSLRSNWSELAQLARKDSIGSFHSDDGSITDHRYSLSGVSTCMSERIHDLVRRFNSRTERFKEKTIQPPTPSTTGSMDTKSAISAVSGAELELPGRQRRLDSFIPQSRISGHEQDLKEEHYIGFGKCRVKVPSALCSLVTGTVDPTGKLYVAWLCLVTLAYLYNATAMTLRAAFVAAPFYHKQSVTKEVTTWSCDPMVTEGLDTSTLGLDSSTLGLDGSTLGMDYSVPGPDSLVTGLGCRNHTTLETTHVTRYYKGIENDDNRMYWWMLDYFCDLLYILDILLVKSRIRFVKNGIFEHDKKECLINYVSKLDFKMDVASLFPLDLFYLIPALKYNSMLRFPRLLKIHTFWEFFDRMDQAARSAHIVRVFRTLTYMVYLIHLESCGYYAMSAYEGLRRNDWVYDGKGIAYIRCTYLATKTATSIGNNPRPVRQLEYIFMTIYWLSGVFVFAMLIGQIRDIFQSAGAAKTHYRKTMDQTLSYMQSLSLPSELQDKVRTWFNYNWEHQKTLNENSLLDALPKKMKADLAIHVHFNTLSKVQLFQNCDKNLLYDLVLKLNPVLYLPGDYICKKGEVGTEMYIVMQGQVEVVGGPNNSMVFATLYEGSVFGEISLLALAGGNRRTADVRAKGFCQIFILCKVDFEEAMREYPQAQKLLKKRAKKLLAQNAKHETAAKAMEAEEIIKSRHGTPKLLKTVVQMVDEASHIPDLLGMRRGSSLRPAARSVSQQSNVSDGRESKQSRRSRMQAHPDTLSQFSEPDEILVIEQTEIPLPSAEVASPVNPQTADEASASTNGSNPSSPRPASAAAAAQPQPDSYSLDSNVNSDIDSILGIPQPKQPSAPENGQPPQPGDASSAKGSSASSSGKSSIRSTGTGPLRRNKVDPAVLVHESDSPSRKTGASGAGESKSNSATRKPLPGRANRVGVAPAPASNQAVLQDKIPAENLVMCSVEIHPVQNYQPAAKQENSGQETMESVHSVQSEKPLASPSSPHLETTPV